MRKKVCLRLRLGQTSPRRAGESLETALQLPKSFERKIRSKPTMEEVSNLPERVGRELRETDKVGETYLRLLRILIHPASYPKHLESKRTNTAGSPERLNKATKSMLVGQRHPYQKRVWVIEGATGKTGGTTGDLC